MLGERVARTKTEHALRTAARAGIASASRVGHSKRMQRCCVGTKREMDKWRMAPGLRWLCALLALGCTALLRAEIPKPLTPEIIAEADRVWLLNEQGDTAACARQSASIVRAAEAFRSNGRNEEAKTYYRRAALVRPWDFELKVTLAELLRDLRENDAGRGLALEVLALAENEALLGRARGVAGANPPPPVSAIASLAATGDERVILLAIAPSVEPWLASEVARRLTALLGVRVGLAAMPFDCGKPARTGRAELANDLRRSLPWRAERMELYMPGGRRVPPQYLSDDQVIDIGEKMLRGDAGGAEEQRRFRLRVEEADKRLQWNVATLLAALQQQYPRAAGGKEIRLALVPVDVGGGAANFLYGSASADGACAVISYYRFAATNTGEPPKSARLADRTFKQVLSSLGFALGVARCPDARCARSFPLGLPEHDAKGTALCDECRTRFAAALGHELPSRNE
ncbi:MAG: hypothetical protein QM691_02225 [Opitutaceae bacterium]